ncbi:hypothetical protein L5014_17485 [Paraburkholderia sp. RG36]|uniref:Uncharacterized protein n=1 Tax=Paraburkholderia tagetis TaxID=2913261 RepID=A0A9X1RRT4_9BURK|nr:hypothetical protein [Paraburkholderia tagetis]MCG5075134.1 hypothetical protein [Paraburkholderia tagetis]
MKFCPACGANSLAAGLHEAAAHLSGTPYYAFACAAAFALVLAALGLSLRHEEESAPKVVAVQVPMELHVFAVPAGKPDDIEQPLLAAILHDRPLAEQFHAAHAPGAEHDAALQGAPGDTPTPGISARNRAADSLRHARWNLDKHNLSQAHKHIAAALAAQPGNRKAQRIRAELVSREHERGYLLAYARLCAREGQWTCARDNAAYALRVDASSRTARKLLSRAIAAQLADAGKNDNPPSSVAYSTH